jgi:hypothetical protein
VSIRRLGQAVVYRLRHIPFSAAVMVLGLGLALWSFAAPPAGALNNRQQILSGGSSLNSTITTAWGAPGLQNAVTDDWPAAGLGERSTQIRMSGGGVLSLLWVRITTQNVPSSGSLTVTVRVNDADTTLTCTVLASGQCQTGAASVTIPNGARLAVRLDNAFVGAGNFSYTYTMLLD